MQQPIRVLYLSVAYLCYYKICLWHRRPELNVYLFVVELREVVDDDGNGEGHDQDAADGAARADDLAEAGDWRNVTVADRRHGDNGPPKITFYY